MKEKNNKKRIHHPYYLWEDFKCGFYNNCTGKESQEKIEKAVEMFNSLDLTNEYMNRVINEWVYSCEHNLTNESLNKIAYIGQAACCIYAGIPNTVTMKALSLLTKEVRDRSDKIALSVLEKWQSENKNIQLCLNII